MTTKRSLVAGAFEELGMAEYIFDATPEELLSAVTRMDRMAAMWDGLFIRLGYSLGSGIDSEAGIPDTAEECFVLQLAIRIASSFGKTPSQDTKINARTALNAMLAANAKRPVQPVSSRLPVGAGNRGTGVLGQQYFPQTTEVEGLDEGAAEY